MGRAGPGRPCLSQSCPKLLIIIFFLILISQCSLRPWRVGVNIRVDWRNSRQLLRLRVLGALTVHVPIEIRLVTKLVTQRILPKLAKLIGRFAGAIA